MDVTYLKHTRKYIRAEITKTHNLIQTGISDMSTAERKQSLDRLKDVQKEIRELNSNISLELFKLKTAESDTQQEYDTCLEYEQKINFCFTALTAASSPAEVAPPFEARNQLKLPQIPLPEYGHREGEDLNKFLSNFESVIGKYGLSGYEKFVFLQRQLRNEALTLINSLETVQQNYDCAKELLQKAFACTLTQQYEAIGRLAKLKLNLGDNPFDFVSKMRLITESFKSLKIDVNLVMQYFIWHGMNEKLQTQFIHITNKHRPSLEDINEHLFDAIERYNSLPGKFRNNKQLTEMSQSVSAVNVATKANKLQYCSLCSGRGAKVYSHSTFSCNTYPSVKSKIDKLRELQGCTKCGNLSHEAQACKFRFRKKCFHCSKYHFSFLCPGSERSKGNLDKSASSGTKCLKTNKEAPKTVTNNAVTISQSLLCSNTQSGTDIIVPTFTLPYDGVLLRGLRDGGCQPCFVTSKFAKDHSLFVLERSIPLVIKGFNCDETHSANIVQLKFDFIPYPIRAITVPHIRTKIFLPGLSKVVEQFVNKGYVMADQMLGSSGEIIENLDFILGNSEAQIMPQTDFSFGVHPFSTCSRTDFGVMLSGSVSRLLRNLPSLEEYNPISCMQSSVGFTVPNLMSSQHAKRLFIQNETKDCSSDINPNESKYAVLDQNGKLKESVVDLALSDLLTCVNQYYETAYYNESFVISDEKLVEFVFSNLSRTEEGRIVMPLLWNSKVCDRLADNYSLAKLILRSNFNKLSKKSECLEMYDKVVKDQLAEGIIEKIEDLSSYLRAHPNCSFLPHMGVFRFDKQSTKCRIVFLSNLCENRKTDSRISHNQAMLSGPNLNKKISTSLIKLRFDQYLLCFDLRKAFQSIALNSIDQDKLLFLWYNNVCREDFTIVGYKNVRLAFGLRCSPALLMLALYYILVLDVAGDSKEIIALKLLIYDTIYMDNAAITATTPKHLEHVYSLCSDIFKPYKFELQQFVTNDENLQVKLDEASGEDTPEVVKLLGMSWSRSTDTLSSTSLHLSETANTKRLIISSIASNYDIFQVNCPLMNRARLFMHKLQCDSAIGWDDSLNTDLCREWKNVAKQVNSSPTLHISRQVGARTDSYELIAFTDASKSIYGVVIYIKNVNSEKLHFLLARNKLVNKQLEAKTIPNLELHAISIGVTTLVDTRKDLTDSSNVCPINIVKLSLYSDSMVALNWINSSMLKLDKMQRKPVFVLNRLEAISRCCEEYPVTFKFVAGLSNPADCVTREMSYKQLINSSYLSGPVLESYDSCLPYSFDVPNKEDCKDGEATVESSVGIVNFSSPMTIISVDKYSSFRKLVAVHRHVLRFVNNLKLALKRKSKKFAHLSCWDESANLYTLAQTTIIAADQRVHFPDIFAYFESSNKRVHSMPNLVSQLNLFVDEHGLLRVRSKFDRWKNLKFAYPLLLAKSSTLVQLLLSDTHAKLAHAGVYSMLAELRKEYYVPHYFSVAKRYLKTCVTCRRVNARKIKLNQSSYREFRASPPTQPFRSVFLDHFGPYWVKSGSTKVKVWVLCITCLWSRAINLKLCYDLTVKEFLRTFQLHIFQHGLPELVLSDMGSQLVAGANIIKASLNSVEVKLFLEEKNIKNVVFNQYYKGCSELGSLVESCVKLTKRLIYGSIQRNVLDAVEFDFVIAQTVHLVNKRPVAFKESLRESVISSQSVPAPITPELLLNGHELVSVNILPTCSSVDDPDWEPDMRTVDYIRVNFKKLNKVRTALNDLYQDQFLAQLVQQATDRKNRYRPVNHIKLKKGDIVLLRETNMKAINFPMAIVKEITTNELDEVTGATVMKGCNREIVQRHSSSLILLLPSLVEDSIQNEREVEQRSGKKSTRAAATRSKKLTNDQLQSDLV